MTRKCYANMLLQYLIMRLYCTVRAAIMFCYRTVFTVYKSLKASLSLSNLDYLGDAHHAELCTHQKWHKRLTVAGCRAQRICWRRATCRRNYVDHHSLVHSSPTSRTLRLVFIITKSLQSSYLQIHLFTDGNRSLKQLASCWWTFQQSRGIQILSQES